MAQDSSRQASADAGSDIIVTARKRGDERLQDVPASISALGADTLAKMGATKFADFAYSVPGLTFTDQGPGLKRYTLRGIQSAGQEQVAVYYDEVPVPGIQSSSGDSGSQIGDLQLYDMERVEVLKGPQGTTFGANSQTGAIRFISKKPNLERAEGSAQLSIETVDHGNAGGSAYAMANAPIVNDLLAIRLVGYTVHTGGYVDAVRFNRKNINSDDNYGVRALARFQPAPGFTLDGMVWIQHRSTHGASDYSPYDSYHVSGDTSNPGYLDNPPAFTAVPTGKFKSGAYVQTPRPDTQRIFSLTGNGDLGFAQATITGSIYERRLQFYRDNTFQVISLGIGPAGANCPPAGNACMRPDLFPELTNQTQSINQKTFEARLNSSTKGPLQYLVGFFYRDRNSDFISYSPIVDQQTGLPFDPGYPPTGFSPMPGAGIEGCNPCALARANTRTIREKAVFGEVTYDIASWLEIMGGARWFRADQHDYGSTSFNFPTFGSTLPAPYDRKFGESRVIKKGQISIKPTRDITIYALASQGFRLGGTNQSGVVQVPIGYKSDSLWNYEIGVKSTWFDRRLIANLALYRIDWNNIQVQGRDPTNSFAFIGNAGAARIEGMELELQARPTRALELSGGFNWLPKRELTENQVSDDIAAPGRKGDKIPRIPGWTANASAQYTVAIPGGRWESFVRADYSYKGPSATDFRPGTSSYRVQHGFSLVNLRVGAQNQDSGFSATVYVENVFDKAGDVYLTASPYTPTTKITNTPRTIGIELSKSF
ncbi:TonB-dependent receptor [Flavisphingomonas formosensis]|uniref:TonB-dependent receptor n=1 Tax=Flavisphingomonas formosensis TaxID=861534 RepID=UPI0018DFB86E|nr:TonB-dependent receptor plug domain-containing protein [Sphingomonas formosensis]